MKVRTFHVRSMHEAIQSIKTTLGPDAVILSTKRIRSWDNGFGLLGGSVLEVMAAIEDDAAIPAPAPLLEHPGQAALPDMPPPSLPADESRFQKTLQGAIDRSPERKRTSLPTRPAWPVLATASDKASKASPAGPKAEPMGAGIPSFQRVYEDLLAQGVEHVTAEACLRELQQNLVDQGPSPRHSSLQSLRTVLLAKVSTAGPLLDRAGNQKIALFIGPSGAGKTTTIAKFATKYGILEQRSLALITMDTYRPAAIEHLRLYADVLGIELTVAHSCDEVHEAVDNSRDAELIMIDTAGFNPYESIGAQRWRGLLDAPRPMEAHLVLAAGTRVPDLIVSASQCADVPSLRLLFTKLDETTGYGGIFETSHRTGVPLSYWGTGQRVPDDLVQAHVDRLGDLLLGGQVKAPMFGASQLSDRQAAQPPRPGFKTQCR